MTLRHWHAFPEALSVRQAMDCRPADAFIQARRQLPADAAKASGFDLDLAEHDDVLEVTACLPGLKPEDIDIFLQGTVLTIEGELHEAHAPRPGQAPQQEERHAIHQQARDASTDRSGAGRHEEPQEQVRGRSPLRGQPRYHHRERRYGRYVCSLALPVEVNVDEATATFEQGVLTITLPKAEQARVHHIEVKSQDSASNERSLPPP